MSETYIGKIEQIINDAPYGMAFVVSDFIEMADYETVKKSLARLEKKATLRRVIRGVYDKPEYSVLLDEYVSPNIDEVAKAIARSNNWIIVPTSNTALNLLGLSTQIPSQFEYLSSGINRTYDINGISLVLKHRANKEIYDYSYKTGLIIQGLKQLGKERIDDSIISKLSGSLTKEEKKIVLNESKKSTMWIYEIIKSICKGDD